MGELQDFLSVKPLSGVGSPAILSADWSSDRPLLLITQEGGRKTKWPATKAVKSQSPLGPSIIVSKTLAVEHGQELKAVFGNIHST